MGFFARLFGRKDGTPFGRKGKWREIRPDYQRLPQEQWTDDEKDHWFDGLGEEGQWAYWEKWSRETYDHPTVNKVKRSVIDMAREAAKASHPQEFGGALRLSGSTITELVLIPGTIQGDSHAILPLGMLPVDRSINGSVHSHPDPHPYPSDADFELFEHYGTIHLILCMPYGPDDWRAYDHTGLPTHLDVVP